MKAYVGWSQTLPISPQQSSPLILSTALYSQQNKFTSPLLPLTPSSS